MFFVSSRSAHPLSTDWKTKLKQSVTEEKKANGSGDNLWYSTILVESPYDLLDFIFLSALLRRKQSAESAADECGSTELKRK